MKTIEKHLIRAAELTANASQNVNNAIEGLKRVKEPIFNLCRTVENLQLITSLTNVQK